MLDLLNYEQVCYKHTCSIALILSLMMLHFDAVKSFVVLNDRTEIGNISGLGKTTEREIKRDTITLPEVNVVSSFDYQTKKIGYYTKNFFDIRKYSIGLVSYNINALCVRFEGGPFHRKNILESIKIDAKKKDSQCLLKLYFKEIDQLGLPGTTLYSFEDPIDPFESVIDLSNYQIAVPKSDFYLCLEIIADAEILKDDSIEDMFVRGNRLSIGATKNKYETALFVKSVHNVGWIKIDSNFVPRIELIVKGVN